MFVFIKYIFNIDQNYVYQNFLSTLYLLTFSTTIVIIHILPIYLGILIINSYLLKALNNYDIILFNLIQNDIYFNFHYAQIDREYLYRLIFNCCIQLCSQIKYNKV